MIDIRNSEEILLEGKSANDSICVRESFPISQTLKFPEQLVVNEAMSGNSECALNRLSNSDCLGLHVSNNPLQKIPKGQTEIWCLFGTQIVQTLLDTGVYKSLIRPTVLNRIQKDAILEKDDEIHTLHCANKMMNETMGSVKLRFTISNEIYGHWFLIFKEQSCPVILGLDFLKENRMCICWDDQQRLELLTQQKWLTVNGVDRVHIDNDEYQLGILKATWNTIIPASLHTLHECGLVLEDGLSANTYHMDVTSEFLNKGIGCNIKMRKFKMYPDSPEIALELMVDFDSRTLQRVQFKEGDVIGVVQFRSTSLYVDWSNPINKDFENMIDSEDGELFGAFPKWFALEDNFRSRTGNDILPSMQLSDEQHKGVSKLLEKFNTLFSVGSQGFKQIHLTEYIIETVGNPIEKKPYPLPMVKMNWVHDEVEHLLKAGII